MTFTIYPAIDLRAGRVVRLRQGDPRHQTEYSPEPGAVAQRWLSAGASWLHVVNLDGAFGQAAEGNQQALDAILETCGRRQPAGQVQFGGGLREPDQIALALELGVRRVILGTLAVEDPAVIRALLEDFGPERIAVSIDARDGRVLTRGWAVSSDLAAQDLGQHLAALGLKTVIFTDISRDGTGAGLNVPASQALAVHTGLHVIASGGVDDIDDVRAAKAAGLAGVVIGRALYEGHVSLEEALQC